MGLGIFGLAKALSSEQKQWPFLLLLLLLVVVMAPEPSFFLNDPSSPLPPFPPNPLSPSSSKPLPAASLLLLQLLSNLQLFTLQPLLLPTSSKFSNNAAFSTPSPATISAPLVSPLSRSIAASIPPPRAYI